MEDLLKSYEIKVEEPKKVMNEVKKPNNSSTNPDYARLQMKMICYRQFVNQLRALTKVS